MKMKVVIVGGVAGGATAAARLRRLNEEAEIILFEKGEYISFANCGLPYYIGEVIKEKEKLLVQTPQGFKNRFNVDVRIHSEVTKINPAQKTVEVRDVMNNTTYTQSYDKLVLSPGAEPIKPPLSGMDCPRIFTLRNIPDTYAIKDYVDNMKPRSAVIVGAGFIGLEVAENLHERGVEVTVVELADHVIGPLDFDMAAIVHQHLKEKNVRLILGDAVKAFSHTTSTTHVELSSGKVLETDMVLMGIGVRPETKLASEAGLSIGETRGILVDEHMRTSSPDIFAVGDAVEVRDFVSGNPVLIPLAGPANKQGRIAADNICGIPSKYSGTQGTSIVKVFDLTVALSGNNERTLKKNNIEFEKSFTHSASHAGYYPGAMQMSIKLLFGKEDGKILGAQIVGYEGADKRLDVLATAIRAGMTVRDLETLELAYAPPFSSAKDPVNIAGFVANNILKGDSRVFHWEDVATREPANSILVDVRTPQEFGLGSIAGAVNIPVDALRRRLSEIPGDKEVLVFCQVGLRGYVAERILSQSGISQVRNLSGGYRTYKLATNQQSSDEDFEMTKKTDESALTPVNEQGEMMRSEANVQIDACGLQCPGPIMQVYKGIKDMNEGEILSVKATDPAFATDIKEWCNRTGNVLLDVKLEKGIYLAVIKKQKSPEMQRKVAEKHDKTFVVFSGDLDKAIATMIIANGAAAMGRKVTLFFTFWGLNILRKHERVSVKKNIISKMFGFMMPRGPRKLSLSKMNMGGMGAVMIRYLMKSKNVSSLEELLEQGKRNGIEFIACNMSMDLMGIRLEELMDGVKLGGVATFLGAAEDSDMSLFI